MNKTRRALLGFLLIGGIYTSHAQFSQFSYQGRLATGSNAANGRFDLRFDLYNIVTGGSPIATPNTNLNVAVSNGLFITYLDFGFNQFDGNPRWLELSVRTNGASTFSNLLPRQPLTPTPYALRAANLSSGGLSGTYGNAVALNNAANSFVGSYTGNGANVTNLNAANLASGSVPDARLAANVARTNQVWLLGGNSGTTVGTHFLGTTDNQPLEFKVNGLRALRIENNGDSSDSGTTPDGAPNLIGGSPQNFVASGVVGATIAGGGATNFYGAAGINSIQSDFGVVGGGYGNNIMGNSWGATIAGGYSNNISVYSETAVIAGGLYNGIGFNSASSAIGGGSLNKIAGASPSATIAGGTGNDIGQGSGYSVIGGGYENNIAANADTATIAGGLSNEIGTNSYYSAIGGGSDNNIADQSNSATIAGGKGNDIGTNSYYSAIGGGYDNNIADGSNGAIIAGGEGNDISRISHYSAISGGYNNNIAVNAPFATISGGEGNDIGTSRWGVIGGGFNNNIADFSMYGTIAGGEGNEIAWGSEHNAIGGGYQNKIAEFSSYATIPGGRENIATNYAFAAGRRAKANHTGAFVWADSTDADFASTGNNQFAIRASGGMQLSTGTSIFFGSQVRQMLNLWNTVYGIGVQNNTLYSRSDGGFAWFNKGSHSDSPENPGPGGTLLMRLDGSGNLTTTGAVNPSSDRALKENFDNINPVEILAKVAAMPITRWNYKQDGASRHIGPMAQDFYAAFGTGSDDKHIATVDADGVALAAIQGLNQKLETQLQARDAEIAELKSRLEKLEHLNSSK